jgi:hypothetical protein
MSNLFALPSALQHQRAGKVLSVVVTSFKNSAALYNIYIGNMRCCCHCSNPNWHLCCISRMLIGGGDDTARLQKNGQLATLCEAAGAL